MNLDVTAAYFVTHGTLAQKLVLAKLMSTPHIFFEGQVIVLAMLYITETTAEIRNAAFQSLREYETVVHNPNTSLACERVREVFKEIEHLLPFEKERL